MKLGISIITAALTLGYISSASADENEPENTDEPEDIYSAIDTPWEEQKENEEKKHPENEEVEIEHHNIPSPDATEEEESEFRETSLFEATVYTGLPALGFSVLWMRYHLRDEDVTGELLFENFANGFKSLPKLDNNPWYINYVGHPIFGSEAYLLARNRDCSPFASFLYSTAASVTWEYAIESWSGGHPSIQDLLVTSPIGSLLGELRYYGKKELMKIKDRNAFEDIGIVLLDPIDTVYRALE